MIIIQNGMSKRGKLESGIIGMQTFNGIKFNEITEYLFDRKVNREILFIKIKDSIETPLRIFPDKQKDNGISRKYLGKEVTVLLNPETGKNHYNFQNWH